MVIRSDDRQRIGKSCHGQANSAGMTESGETDFRDAEGDEL
ncbi:hypothetical protein [Agrobacterium tumefaciens]|nr:hypothetical protein [Agrobacterium tumefaciens]